MSGIVGIVHRDGAPVERKLLRSMVDSLAFRGPDAQEIWSAGPVGFGRDFRRFGIGWFFPSKHSEHNRIGGDLRKWRSSLSRFHE